MAARFGLKNVHRLRHSGPVEPWSRRVMSLCSRRDPCKTTERVRRSRHSLYALVITATAVVLDNLSRPDRHVRRRVGD